MNVFFVISAIVIWVVGCFLLPKIIRYINPEYSDPHPKRTSVLSVTSTVIAICLLVYSMSFVIIPTGYTGVKTTFGQIDDVTVQNGFNWKIPFVQRINKVNNKQQDISFDKDKIWSETVSRTAVYYQGVTVTYQINPEKSAWIYANVSNYKDNLVTENLVSSAVKASSKTLTDAESTNRSVIEPLAIKNLQKSLDEKYGENVIIINKVTISNTDFEDSYNQAIAAKQKAKLAAEEQEIKNKQAVDKAEANAKVKMKNAQAEADAKIISAEAEAKANKLLENSLSEKILKEKYIQKWNGQLPKVITGDDGNTIMIQP